MSDSESPSNLERFGLVVGLVVVAVAFLNTGGWVRSLVHDFYAIAAMIIAAHLLYATSVTELQRKRLLVLVVGLAGSTALLG